MLIGCKETGCIINFDFIGMIYAGEKGTVRTDGGGKSWKLGIYDTNEEAKKAVEILADKIRTANCEIVNMPTSEEVKISLRGRYGQEHHITGSKSKGYGGS